MTDDVQIKSKAIRQRVEGAGGRWRRVEVVSERRQRWNVVVYQANAHHHGRLKTVSGEVIVKQWRFFSGN